MNFKKSTDWEIRPIKVYLIDRSIDITLLGAGTLRSLISAVKRRRVFEG